MTQQDEKNMPVLVIGASGKVGSLTVASLLKRQIPVRASSRNVDRAREALTSVLTAKGIDNSQLEVVKADLTDTESLKDIVKGIRGVILTSGGSFFGQTSAYNVDYVGVKNILEALKKEHQPSNENNNSPSVPNGFKLVYTSSTGVEAPLRRILLNVTLINYGKWKWESEKLIKASGFPFTIVRPGMLLDTPGFNKGISVDQGDHSGWSGISREDVAEVLVRCIAENQDAATGKVFEIVSNDKPAPQHEDDWKSLFANLK